MLDNVLAYADEQGHVTSAQPPSAAFKQRSIASGVVLAYADAAGRVYTTQKESDFQNRIMWQLGDLSVVSALDSKQYNGEKDGEGVWRTIHGRPVFIRMDREAVKGRLQRVREASGRETSKVLESTFEYPPPELDDQTAIYIERYLDSAAGLNGTLRHGDVGIAGEYVKNVVAALDRTVSAAPPTLVDMVVSRAITGETSTLLGLSEGKVIKDKGFVSTSLSREFASTFLRYQSAVVVDIKIPAGSKVLSIPSLKKVQHSFKSREAEVLLPRNSAFRVMAISGNHVEAELLPEGTYAIYSAKKSLYVSRPVLNADEIIVWAKANGFETTLPAEDMHVTVCYSKAQVDWAVIKPLKKKLSIITSVRSVELLGDDGAAVLKFTSDDLQKRWQEFQDAGASWDYEKYTPHITISYDPPEDLRRITPYTGPIVLGPEEFSEVEEGWAEDIKELSQVDYAQIKTRLDTLEAQGLKELLPVMINARDRLEEEIKDNAKDLGSIIKGLGFPGLPDLHDTMRDILRRAWDAGGDDARREVWKRKTKSYAGEEGEGGGIVGGTPGVVGIAVGAGIIGRARAAFTPRAALKWLREKTFWVTDLLDGDVTNEVRASLLAAIKTGETTGATIERLWRVFEKYIGDPDVLKDGEPLPPSRLETIVRTNNTDAYNHGRMTEFVRPDMLPFLTALRYSAILDSRTTRVCQFLHEKLFTPENLVSSGLLPGNHFNALAQGTLILTEDGEVPIEDVRIGQRVLTHQGRWREVYATMRKEADRGVIKQVTLSNGNVLLITDEHPVLTTNGWKATRDLDLGDHLFEFCKDSPGIGGHALISPKDFPALFDEPAIPYKIIGFDRRLSMFGVVNFEDDFVVNKRKVNDVSTNSELVNIVDTAITEDSIEHPFMDRGLFDTPCFGQCFVPFVQPPRHVNGVIGFHHMADVRSVNSPGPVFLPGSFGNSLRETVADSNSLFFSSDSDPMSFAPPIQYGACESELTLNASDGFTSFKMFNINEFLHSSLAFQINHNSSPTWATPTIVTIVEVKEQRPVYNLAVREDQSYHANGVVAHNCRSIIVPVIVGEKVDKKDFITGAEIDEARGLADAKFLAQWDESKHPRAEKGATEGGQWVSEGALTHDGTHWVDKNGKLADADTQDRLRQLVVPPAWKHVMLNSDHLAGMQVKAIDSKGRTVYKYSAEFSAAKAAEKFQRLKAFNEVVPKVRDTSLRDMRNKSLSKQERDTAAATYLITQTGFRIGSDGDTQAAVKAYGATTLLSKHVNVRGEAVEFQFTGKKGVEITRVISDEHLATYIGASKKAGGRLFATDDVTVREYFKGISGEQFKVKDLRTWTGTSVALTTMKEFSKPTSETSFRKQRLAVAKKVAVTLGNTPTVALKAYIDPAVFARWEMR